MKHRKRNLRLSFGFLVAFLLWTVAVGLLDVQAIGPQGSSVGLAGFNQFVHERIGVHWLLYTVTDWLGLLPIALAFGFAMLGALQLFRRKSLLKVDADLLALGGCYLTLAAAFVFFEVCPINYRPVLINGVLEASYPSSTTLLVLTVMMTSVMQLQRRIKNNCLKRIVLIIMTAFTVLMLLCRTFSGVHWITDIIGGALLSAAVVYFYAFLEK